MFIFFRKPDLDVDPENVKVREQNESVSIDNRFGEDDAATYRCGEQLDDRIIGGELCEIDKYF
jgi:hypothetical protein